MSVLAAIVLLLPRFLQCLTASNGALERDLSSIQKEYTSRITNLLADLAVRESWLLADTERWQSMSEVEKQLVVATNDIEKPELLSNVMAETAPILISKIMQYADLSLEKAMQYEQLLLEANEEPFTDGQKGLEQKMRQKKQIEPVEYGKLICANMGGIIVGTASEM